MIEPFKQDKVLVLYLYGLAIFLMLSGLILDPTNILSGMSNIISHSGVLITDYFEIGGIGAALMNAGLSLFIIIAFTKATGLKFSGLTFAAMFTYLGFTFFGKNFVNVIPIFVGVYLYSLYVKEPLKNFIHIAIFATCLAPVVSTNFIGAWYGNVVSIAIGLIYGFLIVPLGSHAIRWHSGYTLYNIGFSGGVFALVTTAIIRTLGFELSTVSYISIAYHNHLLVISLIITASFFIVAYLSKSFSMKEYGKLIQRSGRAVTDFFSFHSIGVVFFNAGVLSLIAITAALITRVPINGPIVGGFMTVIGFGGFGKHPRNTIPVMVGAGLMFLLSGNAMSTAVVLTILFVTCLAPLAGQYGVIIGLLAGALHFSLVGFTAPWQGAFNLYNNGFASGIVAGFLINMIDSLRKVD